jgi:hypothetical protein
VSDPTAPPAVVELVRSVARAADDAELAAILSSYAALRRAADRLRDAAREEDG